MSTHNIRLGCMLSFDEQQEADIIKAIETLNSSHKTGQFVSNIIKIAFDCPEIMDKNNGNYEKGAVIQAMEKSGLSYNRQAYFYQVTKEMDAMKKKVDEMYSMILNTYMLAKMGKHLGLEDKAENELMAQFVVEKQLKELQDTLGISLTTSVFASNKKEETKKIADNALEYIIESYSGIVNELKAIADGAQAIITQAPQNVVETQQVVEQSPPLTNAAEIIKPTQESTQAEAEKTVEDDTKKDKKDTYIETDEIIDFGDADFSALNSFFGES